MMRRYKWRVVRLRNFSDDGETRKFPARHVASYRNVRFAEEFHRFSRKITPPSRIISDDTHLTNVQIAHERPENLQGLQIP